MSRSVQQAALAALRMVSISLPHLAGLARLARLEADPRVGTTGIFASGRLLLNPEWFGRLSLREASFVLAHELMHLALRTHQRSEGSEAHLFNCAHDYVINDLLVEELGQEVPAGGLAWPGARRQSAEALAGRIRNGEGPDGGYWLQSWGGGRSSADRPPTALGAALQAAGLGRGAPPPSAPSAPDSDVLPPELERRWFLGLDTAEETRRRTQIEREALRSVSLQLVQRHVEGGGRGDEAGASSAVVEALRAGYRPPWQLALQRWMEAAAPGTRSYVRPSRRGADRADLVRAGRRRDGWVLHVVLDSSGSMSSVFAEALGAIADFCEAAGVEAVRVLQCDVGVTKDELLAPEQLQRFTVAGLGGSDLGPALERLAEDPEVEAAVVLTDGWVEVPWRPMPYALLWVLTADNPGFRPPHGQVLPLRPALC